MFNKYPVTACDALAVGGLITLASGLWMLSPAWCLVIIGSIVTGVTIWGHLR